MADLGELLLSVFALVFVVGTMLAMGLKLTPAKITKALGNWRLDVLILVANFVIVPAIIISLTYIIQLPEDIRLGITILAFASGAPFIPMIVQHAKGDIAMGVGIMTLLMVATIIVLPIMLPLVIPGITVNAWDVAKPLVFLMLAPLLIGLLIRFRYESFAEQAAKLLVPVNTLSIFLLLFLVFALYWSDIVSTFGTGAIGFSIIFAIIALVVGYFSGGHDTNTRRVFGLSTANRNISAGILISGVNFIDRPLVAVTVMIVAIASLILLMIVAGEWGRKTIDNEGSSHK
ncbi:MAG: bile acid:sodium symporter [Methanomassiliicoccus sp.]|nr:bile acid:sodium symporter [Methanomassiliicoccus sp.]